MPVREHAGWWWLPEDPDRRVPGTLSLSEENRWSLRLLGSFAAMQSESHGPRLGDAVPLILGLIQKQRVTLATNTSIHRQFSCPGYDSVDYRVDTAYVGEWFETTEQLKFSHLDFGPTHLADWLLKPRVYHRLPGKPGAPRRYEFGYEPQKPEREPIESGMVAIAYDSIVNMGTLSAEIRVFPLISVWMEQPLAMDVWYGSYLLPLSNLFSLATASPVDPAGVVVFPPGNDERTRVEVIEPDLPERRLDQSTITPDKLLFRYRDLPWTFGHMVRTWLKIHKELEPVLNLYFSIGRSPSMYLEHQFLSVVQALEGYHRRRFDGLDDPKDVHQQRIDAVLTAAPIEYRSWLEKRLEYSNEKSLRARLTELVETVDGVFQPWASSAKRKKQFVDRVTNDRNTLTHYSPGGSEPKVGGHRLFVSTEALSILMQALLLSELGFGTGECHRLFRRNQRYQFAAQRADEVR